MFVEAECFLLWERMLSKLFFFEQPGVKSHYRDILFALETRSQDSHKGDTLNSEHMCDAQPPL